MKISPLQTRRLMPPRDSFCDALKESVRSIPEKSVIALSSKAVAIDEGRCVPIPQGADIRLLKNTLAEQEAEYITHRNGVTGGLFTILHGTLMGSAGIDESNGNNHLILWPADPMSSARRFHTFFTETFNVQELGVIIVDSHSVPLRNGAVGITIGYQGFLPVRDYRGTVDLFGRAFHFERCNLADSLAVAATCVMGEGAESTPGALLEDIPGIAFTTELPTDPFLQLSVPLEKDYFNTFLGKVDWKRGGGGYTL